MASKVDAKNPYVLGGAALAAIYAQRRYDALDWLRLGWIETGAYPTNTTQATSALTALANIQSRANSLGQTSLSAKAAAAAAKIAAQFPGASTTVVPATTATATTATRATTSGSAFGTRPRMSGASTPAVTVTVRGVTRSYIEDRNTARYLATLPRSVVVVTASGKKYVNDPNTQAAVAAGTLA